MYKKFKYYVTKYDPYIHYIAKRQQMAYAFSNIFRSDTAGPPLFSATDEGEKKNSCPWGGGHESPVRRCCTYRY